MFGNYSIYTYIRPSPTQSYTLFTRFGHNSFTGSPEKTVNVGASAWLRLRQRLTLNVSYQKNNIDSERLPLQDYLFSEIEYVLPNAHSISLKMRWFKFENVAQEDYAFFAAYTIPFRIPAMKKRSFGLLKGTIIDNDQPGAVPMPNVVLSIGDVATMTNKRGEFMFPALAPGLHQIAIDQRSMGMNRIPVDGLPIPVEIAGGRTTVSRDRRLDRRRDFGQDRAARPRSREGIGRSEDRGAARALRHGIPRGQAGTGHEGRSYRRRAASKRSS